ncbi:hypothetical protein QAD02_023979 [Eretmocerus hayati]|uniref:Uncharacterized protein n=1 Tax=Eretmocerus hayati TaxID=131215 RepID=A0ACC2PY32_9HYME|nr:hypothetical protein QAD02_023979 [Eretmocerus hayati]
MPMVPNFLCLSILYGILLRHIVITEPLIGRGIHMVKSKQFPFIALITEKSDGTVPIKHICTGSLITNDYVVTAAKCLKSVWESNLQVIFGSTDPLSEEYKKCDVSSLTTFKIWCQNQGKCTFKDDSDDIGLIKLSEKMNDLAKPSVAFHANINAGSKVRVFGWGLTKGDVYPEKPTNTWMSILGEKDCKEKAELFLPNCMKFTLSSRLSCVASDSAVLAKDADWGGPVLDQYGFLMGIIIRRCPMFGFDFESRNQFNLVLRLDDFKEFINSVTDDNELYLNSKI